MANREQIGEQICAARKALKKTQKQIAEQTGVNKSTLSLIENWLVRHSRTLPRRGRLNLRGYPQKTPIAPMGRDRILVCGG
jgi:DNA-binding XRE family transcriptional regulator